MMICKKHGLSIVKTEKPQKKLFFEAGNSFSFAQHVDPLSCREEPPHRLIIKQDVYSGRCST